MVPLGSTFKHLTALSLMEKLGCKFTMLPTGDMDVEWPDEIGADTICHVIEDHWDTFRFETIVRDQLSARTLHGGDFDGVMHAASPSTAEARNVGPRKWAAYWIGPMGGGRFIGYATSRKKAEALARQEPADAH